jgi:methyl-accepting chemotaxis protein
LLILYIQVSAQYVPGQQINTDSLKLISQISADQLKLAKLQNMIDQKTQNKADAAEKAQLSANDNTTAANNLSDNPENKQLAKDAANKAEDARSDAKKGRKESARLDKLHKEIREMKSKIADEQIKLSQYTPVAAAVPVPPVSVPVPADTTQHQ